MEDMDGLFIKLISCITFIRNGQLYAWILPLSKKVFLYRIWIAVKAQFQVFCICFEVLHFELDVLCVAVRFFFSWSCDSYPSLKIRTCMLCYNIFLLLQTDQLVLCKTTHFLSFVYNLFHRIMSFLVNHFPILS